MRNKVVITLSLLLSIFLFWQCDQITKKNSASTTTMTCEGCHTDLATLNALAQVPVDNGEGSVPG